MLRRHPRSHIFQGERQRDGAPGARKQLAVAHCRSPTEWTPELLLELHRSFLWEPNDKHCRQPSGQVLSRFLRPVVSGGGFASEERLLSLARNTYINARELGMSLIVDYYCGFWPACGVGQMEKLALYVAHEPSRWPVQSVLYMLQMAIECYDGDDGQWEALLAAFYSKWAPAVDFPSAWKSEEVATFFERWCAAMREDAGRWSTTIPTGSWSRTARLPCGLIELQHRGGQSLYFDFGAAGQRGPSDRLTHATETYVRTLVQYVVRKQQGAHTLTHAHRAGLRPRGARGARSGIWREGGGRSAVLGSCYLQH